MGQVLGFLRHGKRGVMTLALGGVFALAAGTAAVAMSVSDSSGPVTQERFMTQDAATFVPTTAAWHDIPSTTFTVNVPSGQHWLAHITFSGESRCTGASWCSMRAISSANGVTSEMLPAAGTNFAFDSGGQTGSRMCSRIVDLSGGSDGIQYTIKLQGQMVGGSASSVFRLDDYLTQLELSAK